MSLNLIISLDQKLFIDALSVKGIKIIGKKDAAKIVKRLKLLFPDELKLIKDTADEIAHSATVTHNSHSEKRVRVYSHQ